MLAHGFIPGSDENGSIPEIRWRHGDDLCNCTFQRIGFWTNPYLARTLEIRLCCMWAKLGEMFPGLMREIPAFTDYNNGDRYVQEPMLWNGEDDMPRHLFHRQIAVLTGLPLDVVRKEFEGQTPPRGWKHDRPSDIGDNAERTSVEPKGSQPSRSRLSRAAAVSNRRSRARRQASRTPNGSR